MRRSAVYATTSACGATAMGRLRGLQMDPTLKSNFGMDGSINLIKCFMASIFEFYLNASFLNLMGHVLEKINRKRSIRGNGHLLSLKYNWPSPKIKLQRA